MFWQEKAVFRSRLCIYIMIANAKATKYYVAEEALMAYHIEYINKLHKNECRVKFFCKTRPVPTQLGSIQIDGVTRVACFACRSAVLCHQALRFFYIITNWLRGSECSIE
jgi:hypothetical protein